MEPWAAELLKVWEENIDVIAEHLQAGFERDPTQVGKYSLEDTRQMMRGGIAILESELSGTGAEMREGYLQSILPGLHEKGLKPESSAAVTLLAAMRIYHLVLLRISSEHREKAGDFLWSTYGKYMSDLVRVWFELLSGKPS
jgi:hypothetical protein